MSRVAFLPAFAALAFAAPAATQEPILVTPGHSLMDTGRLHEGVDTTVIRWSQDGASNEGPTQIEEVAFVDAGGVPAIRLVTTVVRGGLTVLTDTSFFHRRTLAPISHVSYGGGRALSIRYAGGEVTGELRSEGEPPKLIRHAMAEPLFDPSASHLVLRTITWKAGLSIAIPMFKHDLLDKAVTTASPIGSEPVRVNGSDPTPAWVLDVDYGTHHATIWLARDGSRVLAGSVDLPQNRRMITLATGATVPSLDPTTAVVAPGSEELDGNRLFIGTTARVTTVTRPGADPTTIEINDDLVSTTTAGKPTLTRVQTIATPRGTRVDSAVLSRQGLVPAYHSGHMGKHSMQLHFDGAAVTGQYTPEDSTARPIDQELPRAAFDSNVWDLVIASLPLAEGYRARLPMYWYEQGGLVWTEVEVTGSETVAAGSGSVEAWVVTADLNGRQETLWIAKSLRRMVKSQTTMGSGLTVGSTIR